MSETTEAKETAQQASPPCSDLLNADMTDYKSSALQGLSNDVCSHMAPGWVISLCFEDGAAFVQLGKDGVGFVDLPDSADKTLLEQLNDALCVANGWSI